MRRDVALAIAAGLAWQAVAVAIPLVLQLAIDDGIVENDRTALAAWTALLVVLGLVRWGGDAARHWWVERSGARAAVHLRRRLAARLLELDGDRAAAFGTGQLVARATSDVDTIWDWIAGIAMLVTATFTLVAVIVALTTLDAALAAVGLAAAPLTALVALRHVNAQRRAAALAAQATGAYAATVDETIAGIRALKGIGAEVPQLRRVQAASADLRSTALGVARIDATWVASSTFVPTLGIAAGLWIGGGALLDGELSAGALVAFAGWMALLADASQTLTERLASTGEAIAAATRIAQVLDHEPATPVPAPRAAAPPQAGVRLVLEGVAVQRGGRTVVADVDAAVAAGEWLAVLGASGSGKTTLLRLLPRFGEPSAGIVRLGGVDLRAIEPSALRTRVAWVSHAPVLVSGTLGENLRFAAPAATDAELFAAMAAVDGADVVARLGGLEGRIGVGGGDLSGGQRQRVALARALLARPDVLVLDDPTSAIDPEREGPVLDGLRRLAPSATIVLATHRAATAARADRVLVLADGRVAALGGAGEVLAGAAAAAVLGTAR